MYNQTAPPPPYKQFEGIAMKYRDFPCGYAK